MKTRMFLLAAVSAASLLGETAYAQDTDAGTTVEGLVVTGTRAPRSRLDTVSPVDVVSSKELAAQPSTETAQALAYIAPSIDFPRPSITDGTDSVRPATLRGLSPDQTLVLVNGVRQHASALVNLNGSIGRGSSAVDLNAIPMSALSTVEILREGASAQYGSDAIAGVINLRLREAREGGNITAYLGQYNTEVKPARIPGGYKKHDGAVWEISGWKGLPLGADGFLTVSAEYRDRQPTNRADLDPRDTPMKIRSRYGEAETHDATVYLNAGLPLNATWQGYGWLGYQHRETWSAATARNPSNVNNILAIYPDGFLPLINPTIDDISSAVGVKGDIGGYQIDANLGYGWDQIHYRVEHSLNASLGASSPTSFDAGKLKYEQMTASIDVLKPLMDIGTFKETNLAFGAEYRNENYNIDAGELASYQFVPGGPSGTGAGSQGFIGFRPRNETDRSRHAIGAYVDLDVKATDKFDIDVAGRYENYSDFGDKATGKVALRYDFTEAFALRGAVSTGFRAPSLQQQAFTSTAINFIPINGVNTPVEVETLPPNSSIAANLGAKPLKPELSKNYSVGFVYHSGGFELTVDGYQIDIDNRIVLSENLLADANGTATQKAIYNIINAGGGTLGGARFFINGVDSRTRGLDVVARYRFETETMGRVGFTLAGNYNDTKIKRVPALPTSVPIPNPPALFNRINILSFEEGTPHRKATGQVDWNKGPWSAMVKATYYGKVLHPFSNTDPALDVHTGSHTLVDLEARYRIKDHATVAVGANNLFDEYPNRTQTAVNTNGALAWSNYSPFGFNGRFLYTRLSLDF